MHLISLYGYIYLYGYGNYYYSDAYLSDVVVVGLDNVSGIAGGLRIGGARSGRGTSRIFGSASTRP